MRQVQAEMDKAVAAWLESHKAYKKYVDDTQALFEIFSSGWRGPQRGLSEAFDCYCEALLVESGFSRSEVREFYPHPKPNAN
jgi:hypothetical protein